MAGEASTIDMDLYSRQIGTYGMEAMGKLIQMKVFIHGLRGVGIEVAKNMLLAGPGHVTIHDDEKVRIEDLGSNFYLEPSDVGVKTRAEAVVSKL
jgi:ubiquitin-activating enzyme E1